ncbi:MAG TPA: agmatinase [candidate division WOR-3 bacterium]|uniref:Agmatinase n=1 Tax=candidate division WOR-3 bacterium TaxID=2052148 RepID=A0A7V0T620_UNCW3|nr:agmatinase [candidate division WOR-3 bacterium]
MRFYFAEADREDARVVVLGVPLDRTVSHVPGTRFGPDMARMGADNIESFSPYQRRDVADVAVHDAGNLALSFERPERPYEQLAVAVRPFVGSETRLLVVGGEHSITPAIVREYAAAYPDLHVVQLDAHSDLRQEYLGDPRSHATAVRRILDDVPRERVFQLGIRSFSTPGELDEINLYPFELLEPARRVALEILRDRPVYLTLDVDVLDPSVLPDVGTPQPGGVSYRELALTLALLAESGCRVVGADIVEFCPRGAQPSPGASVVGELVRELVLLLAQ